MIYGDGGTGQKPLVNVSRVANGWLVVVHHFNRDKETSPETLAKRAAARQQEVEDHKEREKKRIVRDMTLQLANMAIIGEAAGKAQHKGIEDAVESWKSDEDEDEDEETGATSKDALQKIEAIAEKIVNESTSSSNSSEVLGGLLGNFLGVGRFSEVETHIFSEREKMVEFVSQMLQPILE
jgi:hypothetical protein